MRASPNYHNRVVCVFRVLNKTQHGHLLLMQAGPVSGNRLKTKYLMRAFSTHPLLVVLEAKSSERIPRCGVLMRGLLLKLSYDMYYSFHPAHKRGVKHYDSLLCSVTVIENELLRHSHCACKCCLDLKVGN
ncbi:unnamed protein product [Periconia digitata]|uniref:Uncharacterized protein n=1 Tax=Periconia digitata TaxID=1303443 RepID=A0A9W4XRP3_9PLEO|nr:unnamed protein product [Periconia digitata]